MLSAGCAKNDGGSDSGNAYSGDSGSISSENSGAVSGGENSNAPDTSGIPDEPKEWHELSQTEITEAMGMGWNLGNQLEALSGTTPKETGWGNPIIKEDLLKLVKEQGFSTVRIPVSYLTHIGEGPDYTIEKSWLDRVQEVVDYSINNGLYTIINIHGDGYYTINGAWLLCAEPADKQTEIKAKYEAVWKQIAERFKNYDEHLIFESMNEVFDGKYEGPKAEAYDNINEYNQIFVNTVRKTGSNNTKRWVLMPGWNTDINSTIGDFGFKIPDDSLCEADGKRIMVSVHYYDPYNFTINENMNEAKFQWGKYATSSAESGGTERSVDSAMAKLNKFFVNEGYPVVIGELGVQDKSAQSESFPEFRRYWTEYVVSAAKQNGCVPVYWDNGAMGNKGFAVIDRWNAKVIQPELIEAMMRAVNATEPYEIAPPAGFEKDDDVA
ncbi:MAG: glycoside hydrolase family 5 protein [Oscillospiraceae bacterium]|nr:glycoside hydrolase family 5 protein [Oscillospiraceae bacterium]